MTLTLGCSVNVRSRVEVNSWDWYRMPESLVWKEAGNDRISFQDLAFENKIKKTYINVIAA